MKIYTAGGKWSSVRGVEVVLVLDYVNFLVSMFAIYTRSENWERIMGVLKAKKKKGKLSLFLDSGAHSLYNQLIKKEGYGYADTQAFWDYVDAYAEFVKEHEECLDVYVNVDVIRNPDATWEVQKYLEKEHGLHPLPVVHYGVSEKRLRQYMDRYDYIGIGGLGQEITKAKFMPFCDGIFNILTDDRGRPLRKTHGFALTSLELLFRYPWYSVDSSSWSVQARFGGVLVPKKRQGRRVYAVNPLGNLRDSLPSVVGVSGRIGEYEERLVGVKQGKKLVGASNKSYSSHINYLTDRERQEALEYFEEQGFKLGESEYRTEPREYKVKKGELKFGKLNDGELCKVEVMVEKGLSNSVYERERLNVLYFLEVEKELNAKEPLFYFKTKSQKKKGFDF